VPNELAINIDSAAAPGISVLHLSGPLNSISSQQLGDRIQKLFDEGKVKLILDLAGVPHISSAGVSVFVSAISYAQDRGGDIVFINIRDSIRNGALKMLGLTDMIKIAADVPSALAQFAAGTPGLV